MAATGKTPILLYGSTTSTNAPTAGNLTNSSDGCEIAINVADKNLFFKDSTNVVNTVPIRQSSASSDGWLSSTDWSTFNSKQPAGSYLTSVTVDAPLTGAGTSGSHLSIPAASGSTNGYLSSTDWTTFNNKVSSQWVTTSSNIYFTNSVGIGSTPTYKLDIIASSGAQNIFRAAQSGVSNGFTITSDGANLSYLLNTGNLVFNSASTGIYFNSSNSSLLNDYEQGSWTPGQGSGLTIVGSFSSSGSYTKIGNLVYVKGLLSATTSIASVAGGEFCTGLPYTALANSVGVCTNASYTATTGIRAISTALYVVTSQAATTSLAFSITYQV